MFNLTQVLPAEDRKKIENYIDLFGTNINFIGVDEWLQWWGTEKIKLYKLLGNKLIHSIDFECVKTDREMSNTIVDKLLFGDFYHKFKYIINTFSRVYYKINKPSEEFLEEYSYSISFNLRQLIHSDNLLTNRVPISYELKYTTSEGKIKKFQIQKDAKVIKTIKKLLDFLKDYPIPYEIQKEVKGADSFHAHVEEALELFNDWRMEHSRIISDRVIKAKLCFSIHPLDYITMSDNNKWTSCMNWRTGGCYRIGTVEMMNSNNVICVYLTTSEPFNFALDNNDTCKHKLTKEKSYYETNDYVWNNKRWRQLLFVNKDIIVSGKSYPYRNNIVSIKCIEELRKLAKENLNWTYEYGVEPYKDMLHITGNYSMNRAKDYINNEMATKHNIIFDTKGMYNDMLNVARYDYFCVRNKVKRTKVISISGKANCLCCGETVIRKLDDDEHFNDEFNSADYYNARYAFHDQVICCDCEIKNFNDKRKQTLNNIETIG